MVTGSSIAGEDAAWFCSGRGWLLPDCSGQLKLYSLHPARSHKAAAGTELLIVYLQT